MPHLVVSEPGRVAVPVELEDDLVIGRHEDCGLCLMDSGVSRKHARLQRDGDGWAVIDLGSRHGTLLNGARLDAAVRLRDGDAIQVGRARLLFRNAGAGAPVIRHATTIEVALHALSADEQRLHAFYALSRALDAIRDADELLGRLLDAMIEALRAERGVAGVAAGLERPRQLTRARDREGRVVVAEEVVRRMLDGREGLILDTPGGAAMGAPMQAAGRVVGFIYIERAVSFQPDDLTFLIALARVAGAAHVAARELARMTAAVELADDDDDHEIVGASEPMRRLRAQVARYGASDASVLVRGESGSGKELVARSLHAASNRADQPFVAVNCAAIPETLLESELFGHVKGAFTGATRDKRGRFALAHRGTLFLDEISDLSLAAQAKVLRAVQEGEIQPVGSDLAAHVDVRIVSATHKDLQAEIAAARFREDLYYRLAVIEVEVPPLRARGGDIALLAHTLLARAGARLGKRLDAFTPAALALLAAHPWPGNVRQLANEVERAAILAESPVIDADLLSDRVRGTSAAPATVVPSAGGTGAGLAERFAALEPAERALVAEALERAGGNLSEAARLLGISRIMMVRRADRFGLRGR